MTVALDPTTKSANATITGGGLTLGATNNSTNGARSDTIKTTGKFVFEVTPTLGSLATDTGVGLTNSAAPNYANLALNAAGGVMIYRSGVVYINGTLIASLAGISGNTIMFAVDFDNHRVWIKVTDLNGWNGSTLNDPCINLNGYDISAIDGSGLYPVGVITSLANSETFNFGDQPFSHALPDCYAPAPVIIRHAVHRARMAPFRTAFTALSAIPGSRFTLGVTEDPDTVSMTLGNTIGGTLAATEDPDTFAGTADLATVPPDADEGEIIYVLEQPDLFVEPEAMSSQIVIYSDTIITAILPHEL